MKIRSIIIDDEKKLQEVLEIKLTQYCENVEVIGRAENAKKGYELIKKTKPDLVFLDIQMPEETGLELLSRFDKIDFEIIFVTGYNEFALQALKVSAVDYILKPVENEDLKNAVIKAQKRLTEREKLKRFEVLKHNLENNTSKDAKIVIPGAKFYQQMSVSSIIHCEGWQKYTKIFHQCGKEILSSYNIGVFKDLLSKYDIFYIPHKSHLVNLNHIDGYKKEGIIHMNNGNEVPVSRRKKVEFQEKLRNK